MIRFLKFFPLCLVMLSTPAWATYDKPYMGEMIKYKAKYEDTFVHLARDYNLGYVEMRSANPGVDPWIPGAGKEILLPTRHILPDAPHEGIVINLPEMRLYAFVNGDNEPTTYPLGIGRDGLETPLGETIVRAKTEGPVWRPTPRMREEKPELPEVVEPGPENPLGTHALYLGWPEYAIHGTNRPFGIGRRVSSGCIRMYPEAIKKFYEEIPVGTKVTVVDQPIKLAWIDDELFLEAHTDVEQAVEMEEMGHVNAQKLREEDMKQIIKVAGQYQDRVDWAKVRTVVKERRGYPIKIARKPYGADDTEIDEEGENVTELGEEAIKEIMGEVEEDEQKTASSSYEDQDQNQERKMILNP